LQYALENKKKLNFKYYFKVLNYEGIAKKYRGHIGLGIEKLIFVLCNALS